MKAPRPEPEFGNAFLEGITIMPEFGELDGHFVFYAVVTPDGKIPTVEEDSSLNDPSHWYTSPIGTIAHLSEFALVFSDHDDAEAELAKHLQQLPKGTKVRTFSAVVEEIDTDPHDEVLAELPRDLPE